MGFFAGSFERRGYRPGSSPRDLGVAEADLLLFTGLSGHCGQFFVLWWTLAVLPRIWMGPPFKTSIYVGSPKFWQVASMDGP